MNEELAKNILYQFDAELSNLFGNGGIATVNTLQEAIELQDKVEKLVKQRRDSVDYIKNQMKGSL